MIFLFLYMAVTGFHTPVVRAGMMQIFVLAANITLKKSDSFNILGLSALVICFINPYAVADVSFIMSFCATFGILLISRKISLWILERIPADKLKFLIKALVNILAVSLSAYIFIRNVLSNSSNCCSEKGFCSSIRCLRLFFMKESYFPFNKSFFSK